MCGYQGWHAAEGDGLGRGWYHWERDGQFKPGFCKVDLWPDVSELDPDERYPTAFRHCRRAGGRGLSAHFNRKTVLRHFQWMREYGIDGVFVQRFVGEVSDPGRTCANSTPCWGIAAKGRIANGRTYAVMYDLSGLGRRANAARDGRLEAARRSHADYAGQGVSASRRQAGRGRLGHWFQRWPQIHPGRGHGTRAVPEGRSESTAETR